MSRALLRGLTLSILAWTLPVSAQPTYATQPGWELVLPEDPDGYSFLTAATAFPAATSRFVDGYWLAGRLLAAHGKKLFLQETFGLSDFAVVATLDANMDPSFVKVSPDGEWIAIGVGHGQPLHVAPASLLSTATPPNLSTHPAVSSFSANYYDAVFRDSRHLFINGGWGSGSGIYVLDTQAGPGAAILPLFDDIPGAAYWTPALTTVRMDFAGLGRACFRAAVAELNGQEQPVPELVPPTLVVRESTAPPPHI